MRSTHDDSSSKKSETTAARPNRSPHVSPETAERILSAAVKEFSEHGFTKTTIRSIASAAGVSPGLVIHHFGSKEGLRTACDDHVFAAIAESKAQNAEYAVHAMQMIFDDPDMSTKIDYLMKSLLDPSEHGQRYFEHYVDLVEDYISHGFAGYAFRQSDDPRGQAATIATLALSPSILAQRLQTSLGTNSTAETMTRLAPHLLDLYLNGVLSATPEGQPDRADTEPVSDDARPDSADTDSKPTDPLGGDQS
ncbi:TetR/AcrR family transcriptional regulator [Brevibacterium sp. UCMA 11754]|uniref:TetR/AcrR family transcriptional regulator n=1 Tax=Brevibacterium sp. UCMA 11754 TaxID=2749198 RepID=UPI001F2A05A6|nr:TetR/AcrR family transcriptional regulator [Brevibacterium sp. UCMA 11754]MCF2573441.1 TetR/AcrR family transcriptional regulator [Brevibacterium sp. UCMA 11754]